MLFNRNDDTFLNFKDIDYTSIKIWEEKRKGVWKTYKYGKLKKIKDIFWDKAIQYKRKYKP
jgi:hypothetical protein